MLIDELSKLTLKDWEKLKKKVDKKLEKKRRKIPYISHIDELNKLAKSKKKSMRILALYAIEKGVIFYSKAQVSEFIARNIKASTILAGFPGNKIRNTIEFLKKNANFKWTLESVIKYAESNIVVNDSKKVIGEFISNEKV